MSAQDSSVLHLFEDAFPGYLFLQGSIAAHNYPFRVVAYAWPVKVVTSRPRFSTLG